MSEEVIEVELPGARVAFSTRRGGVSEGPYESLNLGLLTDDVAERVAENRARLAHAVGLDPARVATGWQKHGVEIASWDGPLDSGAELREVDGHTTREPDLGLLVLVADCLPVALAGGGRAAMLHAGWRGLAGGILEKGVDLFDQPPTAVVGPGVGGCCYEVGPEVLEAFADLDGVADGRMLDLRKVAEARLRGAGVTTIEHTDLCTSCRGDLFFSHRRDDGLTGRQCGMVWLTA